MKTRPTFHNEFELCYLRHQYIKKAKRKVSKEEAELYFLIAENLSKNTFFVYKKLFIHVGFDLEDIVNICKIQVISFLGSFSLECNLEKMNKFKEIRAKNHGICSEKDILDKNKADLTCFLKQRMEDLVRVCRQKCKNVAGVQFEEFSVFTSKNAPPENIDILETDAESYGFKKIEYSSFKQIKKVSKTKGDGPTFYINNSWYVCLLNKKKFLTIEDFSCQDLNPYDNIHNMNPEDFMQMMEERSGFDKKVTEFNNLPYDKKIKKVKNFLRKNKRKKDFKKELQAAKKILGKLNGTA